MVTRQAKNSDYAKQNRIHVSQKWGGRHADGWQDIGKAPHYKYKYPNPNGINKYNYRYTTAQRRYWKTYAQKY